MLYMVLPSARWLGTRGYFASDEKAPKQDLIVIPGEGFWRVPLRQRDPWELMREYAEYLLQEFEGCVPMEARVLEALTKSYGLDKSDLANATYRHCDIAPNCTLETALRRLEKQGVIKKKMHTRGWFRRYVYFVPFDGLATEKGNE